MNRQKQKNLVPKLRFPEFRDEGPWEVKKLSRVCHMRAGKFIPASEISREAKNGFNPCFGGNGLRGFVRFHTHFGKYPLIGRQGEHCGNVNLACGRFYATEHAVVAEPLPDIDVMWLYYALIKAKLNQYATGQAQPGLSVKALYSIMIKVPDNVVEQQKIADCLSSLDELINLHTQKLDALNAHKKGLMQQLFPRKGETVPRLRFPEFRDEGPWEVKRLKQILVSISNGLTIEQNGDSNGLRVTRIETIANGKIDVGKVGFINTDQDISLYKLDIGDILFSNINSLKHIGKNAYVDRNYNLYHGMNLLRLVIDKKNNSSKFIFYLINTEKFKSSIRAIANQAVNQASINQTEVGKSLILVPSKPEQQKIADCLSSLYELIEFQAQKLDALNAHKKGLMQQLFPSEVA